MNNNLMAPGVQVTAFSLWELPVSGPKHQDHQVIDSVPVLKPWVLGL